jgi:hypothetical protein
VNVLRALFLYAAAIVRALAYGWILALLALWRLLLELLRARLAQRELPPRARKASTSRCNPVDEPAFRRPDPLLYSQGQLMKLGLAVTWDNPDIRLERNGVAVPSSQLDPNREYDVVARIWNASTDAPVVALPVRFSYLSFGIGTVSHPIGLTSVDLGVKGGPQHPAFASMKWRTPATGGHYCIVVELEPADDVSVENNVGQENTVVGEAQSPAEFTFMLRNNWRETQTFRFEVDTYAIPPLDPCRDGDGEEPERRRESLERHDRSRHAVPPDWSVSVDPVEPRLEPHAETLVRVRITPPAAFSGRCPFNVNAFDLRGFVGGVTLYVEGH